jgi:hypothetical protein
VSGAVEPDDGLVLSRYLNGVGWGGWKKIRQGRFFCKSRHTKKVRISFSFFFAKRSGFRFRRHVNWLRVCDNKLYRF